MLIIPTLNGENNFRGFRSGTSYAGFRYEMDRNKGCF